MTVSSWVGSVWSLRGERGPVIGQVASVDGPYVTLTVLGLEGQEVDGVEVIPWDEGEAPRARVSSAELLARWKRMGGEPS